MVEGLRAITSDHPKYRGEEESRAKEIEDKYKK